MFAKFNVSFCNDFSNTGIYSFLTFVFFMILSNKSRDSKNNFIVSSPGANQIAGIFSFIKILDNQLYLPPPNNALLLFGCISNISKTTPS
jgi:hypothetical protein